MLLRTDGSLTPVRYSYVKAHLMGSVRYLMDVRLVSMAYLLLAEYGKLHLVTMSTSHLISYRNLSLLRQCIHERSCLPRRKFVSILSCEDLRIHNNSVSTMGTLKDVSRTSLAFSPKIARNNLSSAVNSVSPLGVTFPKRMSPARTSAPIRMIPLSS